MFDRYTRSLVYQRAKGTNQKQAFGTERDVNEVGWERLMHSAALLELPHTKDGDFDPNMFADEVAPDFIAVDGFEGGPGASP